ncbi:MAG: capsule assembly Wzi family protein [Fidelibacterota bacterium]
MKKIVLLLFIAAGLFAAEIPVNINDDVYGFLQRMENKGVINLNAAVFPYTRNKVAHLLDKIDFSRSLLSQTESEILDEHLADYRMELRSHRHASLEKEDNGLLAPVFSEDGTARIASNIFSRRNEAEAAHLLTFEQGNVFLWGDIGLRIEQQWKNSHSRLLLSDRYVLQGGLSDNLFFHADFFRYQRENNPNFNELTKEEIGNWSMQQPGGSFTFDNVYSSLVYHKDNLNIGLYHQPLRWGTSERNSLILSAYASPFSYLGFDYQYKALQFSFFHGALLNDSTKIKKADFATRNREKYIAGHRIDLALFDGAARIGLSEMIIYGDRNIEPGYLIPVNFFWSIEHSLMDRDNSLLALDFQTNIIPNGTIYGTLFIDELRFDELFDQWWANKHGLQLGIRYSHHIFGKPTNWTGEASFIRPWTYSHKFFINNYTNNGISLGFPYAGNSQLYEITNRTFINRRTKLSLVYTHLKHGYDEDDQYYGGDPTISYERRNEIYDNATEWLMGDLRTTELLTLNLRYEFYNDAYLKLEMIKHLSGEQNLFINTALNLDF